MRRGAIKALGREANFSRMKKMMKGRAGSRTRRQLLVLLGALGISSLLAVSVDSSGPKAVKPISKGYAHAGASRHWPRTTAAPAVQLSSEFLSVGEADGFVLINVTRTGDTASGAQVDYATLDGTAGQRTKYETAAGTISFAAGETTKTIQLLINDNNYLDGPQTFYVSLSNAAGASLGLPSLATITINDNDTTPATVNLLEDARTFVRQQYYDFLSRYPDQSGWDFWTSQITQCGADTVCLHNKRIDTSNAFFYELEYQQTGAYVFRLYRAAFGNTQPFANPDSSNQAEANRLPSYKAFAQDRARVVGGADLTQGQIDTANAFTQRSEFLARYPATQDGPTFVDALLTNLLSDLGVDLRLQRSALINLFNTGGRGAVLYRLADDNAQTNPVNNRALIDEEYNRAFVATQYFGYLRRDADIGGFLFWLGQVNGAPLRDVSRQHAMVCSFITAEEYLERFSPVTSRSNSDCQFGGPTGDQAPSVNAGAEQTISLPQNTATLSGLVTDDGLPMGGSLTTQWSKVTGPGPVDFSNPTLTTTFATFSVEGTYLLRLFASDGQLTSASFVRVKVLPANVPPDPVAVAPPIDETIATTIYDSTKFLYTGNPPIQTGVAPGTIKPTQVAVLRGRVIGRDNQPIPGAKITILSHPEFGQTFSRADGMFDMAVNGGGLLTVSYTKDGYLPLQRQANAPWQDYSMVHEVAMIPFDPNVAAIDLTASTPIQAARGSKVIDSPAPRQSTLLFKQGTTATMTLPNGSAQPLTLLHVRASEFTVGALGPAAMPGDLPGTSAYTYASEYSIDEAVAAAATDVRFNQSVTQYNENFLNFPVGTIIPSGFYDRQKGHWVPSESGRVVKLLSITAGVADLDVNGAGQSAMDADYLALGINVAERQQLAQLYTVNQSLWRVPLIHFSSWDSNWGYGPPPGAQPPPVPAPPAPSGCGCPTQKHGCIIEVEDQALGEEVAITGTPFSLTYRSSRQAGYQAAYTMAIPLSVASLPGPVKRIELEITIAGRMFTETFPALTNQTTSFTWDGRDAYGRVLQGKQIALVDIGYVYDGVYETTANFGYNGNGIPISGDRTRQEVTLHKKETVPLGTYDARPQALGGWNLSEHHVYDPVGRILYQGDGVRRSVGTVNRIVTNFAGTGAAGFSGDGGLATQAQLNGPFHVSVAPDGSVYIADAENKRIRKVDPNGVITTAVDLNFITGIQPGKVLVAPDGGLITQAKNSIIKIATNGQVTTLAGVTGQVGFSGDGGPATQALFGPSPRPYLAPDGSLYISDTSNNRIRKVSTDGIVRTIAGNGQGFGFSGDGGPALNARFYLPSDLVVTADGTLYFLDHYNYRIRKVSPDGIITTIAGTGHAANAGDGGPATQADIVFGGFFEFEASYLGSLALGPDDTLYFVQAPASVRSITRDGIINTVAGTNIRGDMAEGGPATQTQITVVSVGVGPDGTLYVSGGDYSSPGGNRVRLLARPLPGYSAADIAIPSEDGTKLFQFDSNGRHLRTVNTLTGANIYTFTYDSAGRLTQIADGDNNNTIVERDGAGNPTAIIGPYGQRTTLSLDSSGYLNRISDPLTQAYQFAYSSNGLLSSETDPRNNQTAFAYDALGRLTRDDDPAGGFKTLTRTDAGYADYSVLFKTALNRTLTARVQDLPTGDRRRLTTQTDGLQTEVIEGRNGINTIHTADGETETKTLGPDPRWHTQAPLTSSDTLTTPGGLNLAATFARSVTLATSGNALSLTAQTDTLNINAVSYTSAYTAVNRTFNDTTPLGKHRTTVIDTLGRITQQQIGNLNPVNYAYDARGRLASATIGTGVEARTAGYSYNSGGFLSSTIDPLGRTETFAFDAAGRITQQMLFDGRVIAYAYDAKGNLTSITPPGRGAHAFTFTQVDLGSSYLPPSAGAGSTNYAYNLDRDLTRITRPDAQQINFVYDTAGRLSTLTAPGGQSSYAYNVNNGTLSGISAPGNNTIGYTYDGSLLKLTTWGGTIAGNVSQTYDNFFRKASQSVNGANAVNFTYDNDSLLTGAGSLVLTRSPQSGLVTGTSLGNITDTIGYNNFAEPDSYTSSISGTNLFGVTYIHDKLGRISQKVETIGGVASTYAYAYDQAGRLSAVTLNNGAQPIAIYTYDSNSNRISVNQNGFISNGTYDGQDRLTQYGTTTYSYTANGELHGKTTSGQTTSYDYDVLGNLRGVTLPGGTQIDYVIDGQNRRIGKKLNGTLTQGFLYQDQLAPVAELDGSNNLVSRFVYGERLNVPDYMVKNNVTYRLISDVLGTVRLVVDSATGAIAQRIDYDEFGVVLMDTNPGFQPFGFAGGLYDRDTALVRFGARDYDAQTGRWTTKDPILFSGGDPNLYGYVFSDPINFLDPEGTRLSPSQIFIPYPTPGHPHPRPRPVDCPFTGTGGNYRGGNFTGGNFSGGNFTGGNFSGGNFNGGNFSGGNFTGGTYTGGTFTGGTYGPGATFINSTFR